MKTKSLLAALFCLLASVSPISAQLIIRNNGHAEVGVNPNMNDQDSLTVLKIFGSNGEYPAAARISFGDSLRLVIGENVNGGSGQLWFHGENGIYVSSSANATDTIMYYVPSLSSDVLYVGPDIQTGRMLIQSDERYKQNIEPVSDVLETLKGLEPVTYQLKKRTDRQHAVGMARAASSSAIDNGERYGFLAQNVMESFPELVFTDERGYMSVDYIGLIPILVQSINELRAELAQVKGESQGEAAHALTAAQQTSQSELEASLVAARLYQNAPNPWSSETVIRYSLPQNVASAMIYIYDMQGAQLKSIPANGRGESQVTLTAHDLKAGMYLYALVADGALVDSKQMILTK